ncbi:MAG: hypothetical protein Q7J76_11005 [Candidatus Brocadiaceae bacterium]|uniref:hypothetical protein n=1 Tax=Candidatus Wunengus sp. YC61 TaxID=3367698 RepID=UPI002723AFE0|nr:hypothetical protein [Candidatus Brocadiaceae bacterium]
MKRKFMVFISLSILIAIIFFTSNLPVKNKEVNIQSQLAVTHGAHKFEEPCLQSFEAADHERTGEHALGPFLESILLQKSSHTIFGSTVTFTAENIHEINKTGLPDHPIAIKTPDIIILLMVVLMIFFFTIKVF